MYPNSIYFGLTESLYRYFRANVYTMYLLFGCMDPWGILSVPKIGDANIVP